MKKIKYFEYDFVTEINQTLWTELVLARVLLKGKLFPF